MKIEIKFRGNCLISGELVYGDLIRGIGNKKGNIYILPYVFNLAYVKHCHPLDGVIVKPDTVSQFTGLHDANGVEIYEGDILSDRWNVEVYQNNEGTFMVKFGTNPTMNKPISLKKYLLKREKAGTSICEGYRDCIVIGNIHQSKNTPS